MKLAPVPMMAEPTRTEFGGYDAAAHIISGVIVVIGVVVRIIVEGASGKEAAVVPMKRMAAVCPPTATTSTALPGNPRSRLPGKRRPGSSCWKRTGSHWQDPSGRALEAGTEEEQVWALYHFVTRTFRSPQINQVLTELARQQN